jgi:hypothetical protein
MRVFVYTWVFRGWAYFLSAVNVRTLAHIVVAFFRGIYRFLSASIRFVNATQKKELREANPTKHHQETITRRWAYFSLLTLWIAVCTVFILKLGFNALVILIVSHSIIFVIIGRKDNLMSKVQTSRIAGESFLRSIVDDLTLTASQRKEGFTSSIVKPPVSLASGKGYDVIVRVHHHGKPMTLVNNPRAVAQKLHKPKSCVFVYEVPGDASCVRILVLNDDPWAQKPTVHPLVKHPRQFSLWAEPANLGTKPDYTPLLRQLVEEGDGGGLLGGGAPRSGKSMFLSSLLIYLMLDPTANIHVVDGSAVDYAAVKPVAKSYVGGPDMEDIDVLGVAHELIRELKKEISHRKAILFKEGVSKLSEKLALKHGLSTEWLIIDELAVITEDLMSEYGSLVNAFLDDLQWLIRSGPKYGVFAGLATQRPSIKSVRPAIKALIVFRFAFYISDQPGSMAILGKAGSANRADWLDPTQKGVGIAIGHGQFRGHMVSTDDLAKVAQYAASLRAVDGPSVEPQGSVQVYPEPVRTLLEILGELGEDRLETVVLISLLQQRRHKAVTAIKLAASLAPLGVRPRRFYRGKTEVRGYLRSDLEAVARVSRPVAAAAHGGPAAEAHGGPEGMAARVSDQRKDTHQRGRATDATEDSGESENDE